MSAQVLYLRHPAQPDLRTEIVAAARAVLRGAARHDDDVLTEACVALVTWGDAMDAMEADAMLMAIRIRARRRAHEAARAVSRPRMFIRMDDAAVMLGAAWAVGMIGYVAWVAL